MNATERTTHESGEASPPAPSRGARPRAWQVLAVVLVSCTVLPVAMLVPWLVVTAFPADPLKSVAQQIAEDLAEQGITFDAEAYARGQAQFAVSCVACHTPDGGAKEGLGKDIVHSDFTAGSTDKELLMFLKMGRNPGDPLNTTGVDMPPKGGNPALMDDDLRDLIAFIRGRQVAEGVTFD